MWLSVPGSPRGWSIVVTAAAGLGMILTTPLPAQGEPPAGEERMAEVELVVPTDVVRPGETIPVGVKFTMKPGWHIYWMHPGDAGAPPTFSWNLPGGGASRALRGGPWSATPPQYPTPIRFEEPGELVGFGYEGVVIFPATVTVPASATPGQEAELILAVDYLICEAVCLPESAVATAVVRVGLDGPEDPDSEAAQSLREADLRLPQPVRESPHVQQVQVQSSRHEEGIRYEITVGLSRPMGPVDFFPALPDALEAEDVEVEQEGTRVTVSFRLRALGGREVPAMAVPAVIGFDVNGQRRGVEFEIPWQP